jgi:hypothetical protein
LGRLTEALEPLRAGLEMEINQKHWANAATGAGNLSELELTLGEVALAAADAKQAVTFAEQSRDEFQRMGKRTTHADALHQAGRRDEAAALFREAEEMQGTRCFIRSQRRHCEWPNKTTSGFLVSPSTTSLSAAPRSTRRFWKAKHPGNLILAASPSSTPWTAFSPRWITRSPSSGLLTRAWLRFLMGAHIGSESAQSDLNEAFEIAERGPMRLHLADIYLHRARLFGLSKDRPATYPWESPDDDLKQAEKLIENRGYGRRKEELEDAESALRGLS